MEVAVSAAGEVMDESTFDSGNFGFADLIVKEVGLSVEFLDYDTKSVELRETSEYN